MRNDLAFDIGDADKGLIPARLEFAGDQSIGGVGGVILPEGAVGGVARRFEIAAKSVAHLVPTLCSLLGGSDRRGNGAGTNNVKKCFLDCIVDAQATERDAARLAIIHPAARATVTRDMMLHAGISQRQFAPTAAATDQAGEQGVAMFGCALMSAGWTCGSLRTSPS